MSNIAVQIEGLGKRYFIAGHTDRYRTFRDTISDAVTSPVRRVANVLRGRTDSAAGLSEPMWALKDVTFDVAAGEVVGIIGRNGAGKSTLLKVLSRITDPTEGVVKLKGRVGALLEVGTGFHAELTGRENVYLNAAILGMRRETIDRKFDEIVDFAEIEKFIDTPVKHYSSGMGLRLGFSVAAHLEPEILIVDEVLAVGDLTFQRKCLNKMEDVSGEGRTVLFVSHNMAAIQHMCDRVVWLERGVVKDIGATDQVVTRYQDEMISEMQDHSDADKPTVYHSEEHHLTITGVHTDVDMNGDSADLVITLQGNAQQLIRKLFLHLLITTRDGVTVMQAGDKLIGSFLEDVEGDWSCQYRVNNINHYIAGGDYVIGFRVLRPQLGTVFTLKNLLKVTIPERDVYGTGTYFNQKRHGIVALPVEFEATHLAPSLD